MEIPLKGRVAQLSRLVSRKILLREAAAIKKCCFLGSLEVIGCVPVLEVNGGTSFPTVHFVSLSSPSHFMALLSGQEVSGFSLSIMCCLPCGATSTQANKPPRLVNSDLWNCEQKSNVSLQNLLIPGICFLDRSWLRQHVLLFTRHKNTFWRCLTKDHF